MLRAVRQRLRSALPRPHGGGLKPRARTFPEWLPDAFRATKTIGPVELAMMEQRFAALASDADRLAAAKMLLDWVAGNGEKMRLLCGSEHYLQPHMRGIAVRLAFIAGNYVLGQSARALRVAESLAADWPNPLTAILHARVTDDAVGPEAEYALLTAAAARYPGNLLLQCHLIDNLMGTNRVDEANRVLQAIRPEIEQSLADEIAVVKRNQAVLDRAVAAGAIGPEGEEDIYTDEMCLAYWTSYFESFVTRLPHQHGDRLLLERFVAWVRAVEPEVDVILDFGSLCAQLPYEAALAAPRVQFIGTDRQQFIADMNRAAYPLPNLSFDHGDIFDVMERVSRLPGRKALAHVRTTCTLYPRMVEELYRTAARLDFGHIYMIENGGLVRSRLEYVPYETMQEPALVTKHRLALHNYHAFLTDAGYALRSFARVRAPGLWRGDHPATYLGSQYEIHAALAG